MTYFAVFSIVSGLLGVVIIGGAFFILHKFRAP